MRAVARSMMRGGAVVAMMIAAPAMAVTPITGVDALREWNLIVFGNLTSSSEVEGRTFVGGNLEGNSSNYLANGSQPLPPIGTIPALSVVGDVNGSSKQVNNGGGAAIGGNLNVQLNANGPLQTIAVGGNITVGQNVNGNTYLANQGAAFTQALVDQRDALVSSLGTLSSSLSVLADTAGTTFGNVGNDFTLVAPNAFNVINVAGNFLDGGPKQIYANFTGTTVINVSGTSLSFDENFQSSTSQMGQYVIWNFYEATNLSFGSQFNGTVLAPLAHAVNGNFIEGSAVFASMTQNGEVHLGTFNGTIPSDDPGSVVPEPASWAMMIGGFGLIGGALRRRRRAGIAAVA